MVLCHSCREHARCVATCFRLAKTGPLPAGMLLAPTSSEVWIVYTHRALLHKSRCNAGAFQLGGEFSPCPTNKHPEGSTELCRSPVEGCGSWKAVTLRRAQGDYGRGHCHRLCQTCPRTEVHPCNALRVIAFGAPSPCPVRSRTGSSSPRTAFTESQQQILIAQAAPRTGLRAVVSQMQSPCNALLTVAPRPWQGQLPNRQKDQKEPLRWKNRKDFAPFAYFAVRKTREPLR